jgi:hypothetical protein
VSPDGGFVASASWDGTLKIWDVSKRATPATLRGHTDRVWRCAISPDGAFIASASADKTVRIWDVASGSEQRAFRAHTHPVRCCAVSPDGALLASGDEAGNVRVWDSATGAERATIALLGIVGCIVLHPSVPMAVCGDLGGNLYLIDLVGIEYGPIIVTAADEEEGRTVRCPICHERLPLEAARLGQVVDCPRPGCDGLMRVNTFVTTLPSPERVPRRRFGGASTAAETVGGYVQRCLEPAFVEAKERRDFQSDPSFRSVLDPLHSDDTTAAREAEKLAARFPDLDLAYSWWGDALMSLGEFDRAREVLRRGLERSRRKFMLCTSLGEVEWRAGNLPEAVYSWAQAVHCQESLEDRGHDVAAYLYLLSVAIGLEEADAAGALLRRVDAIRRDIRLVPLRDASLREFASREGTPEIREVLRGLRTRYLQ